MNETESETLKHRVQADHEDAYVRWAIQIGTVDSLKWNGYKKTANFLGRNSIEHSFTRLALIWCDKNDKPLKDPETGELYPEVLVRGELNPGAIDSNGNWSPLRIDPNTIEGILSPYLPKRLIDGFNNFAFVKERSPSPKCKLGIFSYYGYDISPFNADNIVEEPVMVGDLETMDSQWILYQRRAAAINAEGYKYNLKNQNCHTINAALNKSNASAVKEFASRGFLRLGENPNTIKLPEDSVGIIRSLQDIEDENISLSHDINESHKKEDILHFVAAMG